jgi:hypothetical protein
MSNVLPSPVPLEFRKHPKASRFKLGKFMFKKKKKVVIIKAKRLRLA